MHVPPLPKISDLLDSLPPLIAEIVKMFDDHPDKWKQEGIGWFELISDESDNLKVNLHSSDSGHVMEFRGLVHYHTEKVDEIYAVRDAMDRWQVKKISSIVKAFVAVVEDLEV